jgi:hypothetical protein
LDSSTSTESYSFKVVTTADASVNVIGISQEGITAFPMATLNDMGVSASVYAAISGQNLKICGVGEVCLLSIIGAVYANSSIIPSTGGYGIMASGGAGIQYAGAIALQTGVSGDKIRVLVLPHVVNTAAT